MSAPVNRREALKTIASTAAVAALAPAFISRPARAEKTVRAGFIYVGPRDDYGYNQAHYEGKLAVDKLGWVKTVDQEKVPETTDVQEAMESMIQLDRVDVLFPTSFGYFDPHILKVAKQFPDKIFLHCGGLWKNGMPANAGSYFGYIDEAQYVSGTVAGLTTRSNKLGFVAAKPIPQVLRNINSFTLGARRVNAKITTQVIFTGDWALPVKEAEATNSLIGQGVDVITMHVDSPKVVVETCERKGIFVGGYHANQSKLAPKGYLTGAEWNWAKVYGDYAKLVQSGQKIPNLVRGGLSKGVVQVSPYGPAVSEGARKAADKAKADLSANKLVIYRGPINDNKGKTIIAAGKQHDQTDIWLESMNWLTEGVIGQV